ncbi:predicted protein [Plenodomus lingam JN3]|uniref:Predicted protein n=1 Tax=Leptosphaeria maculans (strain JN3 / isolate v23.1.3 / race Av1-4-5-6-7-8) TaxID=985895 RepID=E4ZNC6_LEPMJ|nr:predicted protein [Plenodomus lingam JN3]CBX92985.1 predicted protein [Plenodomus lingam JN3]
MQIPNTTNTNTPSSITPQPRNLPALALTQHAQLRAGTTSMQDIRGLQQ